MNAPSFHTGDALIVVDVQKDFCPGGALPVPDCTEMLRNINECISTAVQAEIPIIASRDWHPKGHVSFHEQGGPWPEHCVQSTEGAEFCDDLWLPSDVQIVDKGDQVERDNYSDFDDTGLTDDLKSRKIERVWITGVALEVCVRATALDALQAGFEVHVLLPATAALDDEKARKTLEELETAGVIIEHPESQPQRVPDDPTCKD